MSNKQKAKCPANRARNRAKRNARRSSYLKEERQASLTTDLLNRKYDNPKPRGFNSLAQAFENHEN